MSHTITGQLPCPKRNANDRFWKSGESSLRTGVLKSVNWLAFTGSFAATGRASQFGMLK